jgi:hypothetical protein
VLNGDWRRRREEGRLGEEGGEKREGEKKGRVKEKEKENFFINI